MIEDLILEADWAAERGCSVRTVQRERALREGPPYIRLGKKVFYRREALRDWILAREQNQPRANRRAS